MIRVFARKTKWTPTDDLVFYDGPPLYDIDDQPVHVSCTFTWDIAKAYNLAAEWACGGRFTDVKVGGPAFNDKGGEFFPGRYLAKPVTITSRGCCKNCSYCYVPKREGLIRELPIRDGWVVQDNNLLACTRVHIDRVFEMLSRQPIPASFPGGLDIELLKSWHIDLLEQLQKAKKLAALWVAFDTEESLDRLYTIRDLLGAFSIERLFAYVLIGFRGDTIEDAEKRLNRVYDDERGFLPFAMLFDGNDNPEWKMLQRKWCRPAAYRTKK